MAPFRLQMPRRLAKKSAQLEGSALLTETSLAGSLSRKREVYVPSGVNTSRQNSTNYSEHNLKQPNSKSYPLFSGRVGGEKKKGARSI